MEAAKYALWLNPLRCSSFFANQVLLVEGATERALIDTMLSNNEIPDAPQGTFVLDTLGKYNIHRFMNLFHRLGIPHAVLFDLDEGSHPEIAKTISDSRNEMTLGIKGFKGEIEDFLGVDKTDHWRKPQHVLCQYREGRINTERISSLVDIVSNILTN
jgi:predicted ATP-dependent endonuclease of OLD family